MKETLDRFAPNAYQSVEQAFLFPIIIMLPQAMYTPSIFASTHFYALCGDVIRSVYTSYTCCSIRLQSTDYSAFQVGEIGSNGEIGIDAKITQTTNPIVNMTKTIGLWLMLF